MKNVIKKCKLRVNKHNKLSLVERLTVSLRNDLLQFAYKLQMTVQSNHAIALVSLFQQSFENSPNHAESGKSRKGVGWGKDAPCLRVRRPTRRTSTPRRRRDVVGGS